MTRLRLERLEALRSVMGERGVAHLWVEPSVGFRYLTDTEPVSFERLAGLLIPQAGDPRAVAPDMAVEELEPLGIEVLAWSDSDGPEAALSRALSGVDSLSIQGSLPAWAWHALATAAPAASIEIDPGTLSSLREVKDADEVEALRRSAALADEVAGWIADQEVTGLLEAQLAGRIQAYFLERGAKPWDPLVATGANAAMPHYIDATAKIDPAVPLLCDFGGTLDAYLSDITRVFFPSSPTPQVASAYEVVCAAHDAALATVAEDVPCAEVDRAARRVIEEAGYGDAFIHRTGHGLGLDLHEPPYLHGANEQPLRVGNVFSIEPGIYIAGSFGLRYENIVHLGPEGPEVLNRAPRDLKLST